MMRISQIQAIGLAESPRPPKYRFESPFIDGYGLALNQQNGFNWHEETAGIKENHLFVAPTLIFQKNF